MIIFTAEQEAEVENAFEAAIAIRREMTAVNRKAQGIRTQIKAAGSGGYSHLRLAKQAMGQDVDDEGVRDAGELPRLRATLQGLNEMLTGLEDDYALARVHYKDALLDAMRSHLDQLLDNYDIRAEALVEAWKELGNMAQWFREQNADTGLPGDFFSAVQIPNTESNKPALLSGRSRAGFKLDQALLTPSGEALLGKNFIINDMDVTTALVSTEAEKAKAG